VYRGRGGGGGRSADGGWVSVDAAPPAAGSLEASASAVPPPDGVDASDAFPPLMSPLPSISGAFFKPEKAKNVTPTNGTKPIARKKRTRR